ncbi:hypothetical protein, partial [Rhodosalinus sediminis]|uniref:hypothetical protein n=1 Tax=Rhodosalinus sediminis TaxID=1940533 RepID=UPI002354D62F
AGERGVALTADGMQAEGNIFLGDAETEGEVRLAGARLGGDLDFEGAQLRAGEGSVALTADGLSAKGALFWRELKGIEGVLDLTDAEVSAVCDDRASWPKLGDLMLDRFRYSAITGKGTPLDADARIDWLDRQDPARVGADFWPQPWEQCAKVLREMGHREDARRILIAKEERQRRWMRERAYARLEGARCRSLLERGTPDGAAEVLKSRDAIEVRYPRDTDPRRALFWEEAGKATALRDGLARDNVADWDHFQGEVRDRLARMDVPGFSAQLAARDAVKRSWLELWGRRIGDALLGTFTGYGYRPGLSVRWLCVFWLFGAFLFWGAAQQHAIKPNDPFVLRSAEWAYCAPDYEQAIDEAPFRPRNDGARSQLACFRDQPEAQGYPAFNALVYSADTLLPVVEVEMQAFWLPDDRHPYGAVARYYLWVHIALGWAFSILAVAGFTGLIRTEDTE